MQLPEGNQELIDTLILEGALVISGVDNNGEIVYQFTDKLKELAPELYDSFMAMIQQSVMDLWEKGFLNMDVTQENPLVSPTEKALDQSNWHELSDSETQTMFALMKAFGGNF